MELLQSVIVKHSEFLSQRNFQHILNLYSDDLPSFVCFNSELDLRQHKWMADSDLASTLNTPKKTLEQTDPDFFPNMYTLFCIKGTLPVTSCECERSISMLKLIKVSTLGQECLNGLAMLYYHRSIKLTPEEVVDKFARCHTRRMLLSNIFYIIISCVITVNSVCISWYDAIHSLHVPMRC